MHVQRSHVKHVEGFIDFGMELVPYHHVSMCHSYNTHHFMHSTYEEQVNVRGDNRLLSL